jgi:flagellar hook assembly protein FlgD
MYDLPKTGAVTINVFNLSGEIVKTLFKGTQPKGSYSYTWDGTNKGGRKVARGIYFIRVVGPDIDEYRKVMVVKD